MIGSKPMVNLNWILISQSTAIQNWTLVGLLIEEQSIEIGAFLQGKIFFFKKPLSKSHFTIIYQNCTYCIRKNNPFPSIMSNHSPHFP